MVVPQGGELCVAVDSVFQGVPAGMVESRTEIDRVSLSEMMVLPVEDLAGEYGAIAARALLATPPGRECLRGGGGLEPNGCPMVGKAYKCKQTKKKKQFKSRTNMYSDTKCVNYIQAYYI